MTEQPTTSADAKLDRANAAEKRLNSTRDAWRKARDAFNAEWTPKLKSAEDEYSAAMDALRASR